MVILCLSLVGLAFLLAVVGCAWTEKLSRRKGWLDSAGSEPHKPLPAAGPPVPNTGGIGVYLAVALPLLAILGGVSLGPAFWDAVPGVGPVIAPHLPGLRGALGIGVGILLSLTAVHLLGLIDDRRALGPWLKLAVQAGVAAALVVFCDLRVLTFLAPESPAEGNSRLALTAGHAAMFLASLAWIIVITNAMNFLDNMDGVAGGVGLIAAGLYLAATLLGGQWFVAGLAALLCGALAGFLLFNHPPAKLYLGDGGSLVLGLMLAVISVRTTYTQLDPVAADTPAPGFRGAWYGILMPLLVLAVPLYDFTSVTTLRLLRGQSPLRGDHNHFSHRLRRRGLGPRAALAVILLATLATGLGGVMLGQLAGWQAALVAAQALAVLTVLALLEAGPRRTPAPL
ncbi:MAG: MraY family glycosyltransferase [Planctomycetota bacterium]